MQHPLPKKNFRFVEKASMWYIWGGELNYMIVFHLQTVGGWLRGSLNILRSLLTRLAWKNYFVFSPFWRYSWSHHAFCPTAFNLANTKCRCSISKALIWLKVEDGTSWKCLKLQFEGVFLSSTTILF